MEFQAVFLACLQPDAAIVPLLCSFGWEEWSEDRDQIDRFCHVIRRCVFDCGRSVGVLASASSTRARLKWLRACPMTEPNRSA